MAYSPSVHTLTGKAIGYSQATPTDARAYFYDAVNFLYRPYQSVAEVLAYLNLPKYRAGSFPLFINSTGVLNPDGSFTGGTIEAYWFKDGTADANLKQLLDSPKFLGIPTAPTAAVGTNTDQLATTAFVTGALNAFSPPITELNIITATTYTLLPTDYGNILSFTAATPITLTIPTGLQVAFHCVVWQNGLGQITSVAGSGATIYQRQSMFKTIGQGSGFSVNNTATNFYNLQGDLQV